MYEAFWVIWSLLMSFCVWGFICNERTHDQRISFLPKAGDPKFWEKRELFHGVTYKQHFLALMLLRDPHKLYNSGLFE